ncbi:Putative Zinc finger, RING-type, MATH/TRAF domain, Zinc finger, RING/FYVE/PHD-type [Septoria linicola]|uniref:Zinc finger, RING-type, MATH/TRAF domain, Zinc finger, RING/FYVE/PHD-type n=1 Tax=Septoria linicola TaxID=215465 RepID=A0A9Q9ARW3_9PEZI|nr:Putative Zinc finger, RING-type, MATH/TRAF domain, Zinc finger, RING/FYVE/PHD-type [Septoria linicola]
MEQQHSGPVSARRSPPPPLPHLSTNTPPVNNGFPLPPELATPTHPVGPLVNDDAFANLWAEAGVPPPPGANNHIDVPNGDQAGGADSDQSDSEDDDNEQETGDHDGGDDGASDTSTSRNWQPLEQDAAENKLPCEDELKYIEAREEHSALDEDYWHQMTFPDVKDPEITVVETATIDWQIPSFNGTAQEPVSAEVMHSQVVHIGGYDWQIKFYPRGRRSEYPSVYLENVTMQSPDFAETEDFVRPPLPFLDCQPKVKKRRSVAAQLSVVLYNPSEPRVYNHRTEAFQFHKKSADIGWKYFTRFPRPQIALRQHGMRKALLTDDKLSFRAYIRVMNDPTGCLWDNSEKSADDTTAITGLRPFTQSLSYLAATIPLLHFSPFREFVKGLRMNGYFRSYFQHILFKMFTRRRSPHFGQRGETLPTDAMETLYRLRECLQRESVEDTETARRFNGLVGEFHPERNFACGPNRLDTKTHASVQEAVNKHTTPLSTPQLLTLELTRQYHDKETRKWKKVTNRVDVSDDLEVSGQKYTLFAFVTHCGHLQSSRYNTYVRPHGIRQGWYAYHDGRVTRLTEKQARDKHSGGRTMEGQDRAPGDGYDSPFDEFHNPDGEVTCAVMYARNDVRVQPSDVQVESWLPEKLRSAYALALADPPNSAVHEWDEHRFADRPIVDSQPALANGEAAARISELTARITATVEAATPEPPELRDGDGDIVMRDTDESSNYEVPENIEISGKGIRDWLGRPFYEGEWSGTEYHGTGHLIELNGDEYIGEFRDGEKNGWGKIILSSTGDIYEGTWEDSQMHGKGKLIEKSTGNVFEGNFREGRKHGEFILRGTVTDEDKSTCQICYDNPISTAFYDCGHVVACRDCAAQVDSCPMCRRRVVARLQLYGVRVTTS